MPTIHLLIKGKVQGVFYRASARETAEKLQIGGWVRNTPEGHVEILANGGGQDLERFIEWCRRGPARAVVQEVLVSPADDAVFTGFSITRE